MRVGLDAIEHVLPSRRVSSEELAETFIDISGHRLLGPGVLERLTGVVERRWVDVGIYSSDLAAAATDRALSSAGLRADDVDLLIFASASHDLAEPATANRVQMLTGCTNARALDVKNACNSFLDGLDVARALVAGGGASAAIVATGEVLSPFVQTSAIEDVEWVHLVAGLTLGDAGAAAVIRPLSASSIAEVRPGVFRTFGEHWSGSRIMAGGSMTGRDFSEAYFWSDSASILSLAVQHVPTVLGQALRGAGWCPGDVDLVIPHQASISVIRKISDVAGIPFEKCVVTARDFGNTAAASIPLALSLARQQGRLDLEHRVMLVGGAAGFSAAAMPMHFCAP
jgi:acyl-CoA:acyl-CoA alkyltransferase